MHNRCDMCLHPVHIPHRPQCHTGPVAVTSSSSHNVHSLPSNATLRLPGAIPPKKTPDGKRQRLTCHRNRDSAILVRSGTPVGNKTHTSLTRTRHLAKLSSPAPPVAPERQSTTDSPRPSHPLPPLPSRCLPSRLPSQVSPAPRVSPLSYFLAASCRARAIFVFYRHNAPLPGRQFPP